MVSPGYVVWLPWRKLCFAKNLQKSLQCDGLQDPEGSALSGNLAKRTFSISYLFAVYVLHGVGVLFAERYTEALDDRHILAWQTGDV